MVKKTAKTSFNTRSRLLTVFLLLFFLGLTYKLFYFQVLHGLEAREQASAQHSIYQKLLPSRGEILLSDKSTLETVPVATNLKSYLVYAVPHDVINAQLTASSLASVLGLDEIELLQKIQNLDKKYVPLKKKLTEEEQRKIKELKLSGIFFDSEDTRYYPENNLLSQTLGFVGYKVDTKHGLYGLERKFDDELAGKTGELQAEKDIGGALIFGAKKKEKLAEDGVNLILTIDKTIQFQAESIIKEAVITNEADGGSVIVANPKTGAILAIANYPDFNLNEYNKVEDPRYFTNLAVTGNYEPGSVFKAITMAAAINEGKITADTTYTDAGFLEIDGYKIKNSDGKAHGIQTMEQALDESLNTGAIWAKDQIGNAKFYEYLRNFGFGAYTGIELPETRGNLEGLKANIQVDYATASFGQGITVTPMQLVQAYIGLANEGKMMKPFIVQSKIYDTGKIEIRKPEVVKEVITPRTANIISAMLVSVVENGHGKKAGVPGYYMAGKTGTAQVPRKDGKGYEADNNIGSFIGYGPVEEPQFVILMRVDHPRNTAYAETTAAPAWGKLAQFILNYLNIAPTRQFNSK